MQELKILRKLKDAYKKKYSSFRRSPKISKQILHLKVRDFLLANRLSIGLDIGCASMPYRPLFKTEHYIGVDLDSTRLKEGLDQYPETEICESSLFDMPENIKGDLVVCIQMIEVNAKFDNKRTMEAVDKLIRATNYCGALIFNVGVNGNDWQIKRDKIAAILKKYFNNISIDRIGFYNQPLPMIITLPIAYIIKSIPFLYHISTPNCLLFSATGKKQ